MKSITFKPTEVQYEHIQRYRKEVGIPISVLMRKAVDFYFTKKTHDHLLTAPYFSQAKNRVET